MLYSSYLVSLIKNIFNSGNSVSVGDNVKAVFTLTQCPSQTLRLAMIQRILREAERVEIIVRCLTWPGGE